MNRNNKTGLSHEFEICDNPVVSLNDNISIVPYMLFEALKVSCLKQTAPPGAKKNRASVFRMPWKLVIMAEWRGFEPPLGCPTNDLAKRSPSIRRAWIELTRCMKASRRFSVAFRIEGVDWNGFQEWYADYRYNVVFREEDVDWCAQAHMSCLWKYAFNQENMIR